MSDGIVWTEGGITVPEGFRAAGVAAGIKPGSDRKDCALVVSERSASLAGTFTTNRVQAAPVLWCRERCLSGTGRAVFLNSGNANACTGSRGMEDVRATAQAVARGLGIGEDEVCICSTGVIGVPLPMSRILDGVRGCVGALSRAGASDAARAIMTTDTVPKERACTLSLPGGGTVHLGAMAKGSGMIAPRMEGVKMATMLAVITTDAAVDAPVLQEMLEKAVSRSFNRICVDNDTSTNDTVLCLANGAAERGGIPVSGDVRNCFEEALILLCQELAKMLVRDGEGASKLVTIEVEGAESEQAALQIARSVAQSQLCKTAFFGEDPNWGRFACAVGYAGVPFSPESLSLWLGDIRLVEGGQPASFDESAAAAIMKQPEFTVRICVGEGPGRAVFWTSDLSHDYVSINADYRS